MAVANEEQAIINLGNAIDENAAKEATLIPEVGALKKGVKRHIALGKHGPGPLLLEHRLHCLDGGGEGLDRRWRARAASRISTHDLGHSKEPMVGLLRATLS